jgi:hypothetical protein
MAGVGVELWSQGMLVSSTTSDHNGLYEFNNVAAGTYAVRFVAPPGYQFTLANQGSDDNVDSDADPSTGYTPSFTLAAGEVIDNIDGGILSPSDLSGAQLGDRVWLDLNGNGLQDPGEPGRSGVGVELWSEGMLVASTTTGPDGQYFFFNLASGYYSVRFVAPAGFQFTAADQGPDDVDSDAGASGNTPTYAIAAGLTYDAIDAGLIPTSNGAPVFRLAQPGYVVYENELVVTVTIARDTTTGDASVRFYTTDGSAIAGEDYEPISTLVSFQDGQSTATATVTIIDDLIPEGPGAEHFFVHLSDPSLGYTIDPTAAEGAVKIIDDDGGASPPDPGRPPMLEMDGAPAFNIDGGSDSDVIGLLFGIDTQQIGTSPRLLRASSLAVVLDDAYGNDRVQPLLSLDPDSVDRINTQVFGESNTDELTLEILGIGNPDFLTALINGGDGIDRPGPL